MKNAADKSSIIDIPDIDKIFAEGREPTEEEWKIWAEHFKPKRLPQRVKSREVQLNKESLDRIKSRENMRKVYKRGDGLSYGRKYNEKRRYLYKYNKTWRENLQNVQTIYMFRITANRYESWRGLYRRQYKNRLQNYAQTYKISDEEYVYGFDIKLLREIGPFSLPTFKRMQSENLFPEPTYEGFLFKNKKIEKKPKKFYLLTEAIAYFDITMIERRRLGVVNTEEKKLYLKKKFWDAMLKAREEFDNGK